jgi:hypothetical protein
MACWFLDRGGGSLKDSVIIYADNFFEGISIILDYLILKHGKKNSEWKVFSIQQISDKDKKYEIWSIEICKEKNKKEIKTYYFDISGVKKSKNSGFFFKFLS